MIISTATRCLETFKSKHDILTTGIRTLKSGSLQHEGNSNDENELHKHSKFRLQLLGIEKSTQKRLCKFNFGNVTEKLVLRCHEKVRELLLMMVGAMTANFEQVMKRAHTDGIRPLSTVGAINPEGWFQEDTQKLADTWLTVNLHPDILLPVPGRMFSQQSVHK